MHSVLVVGGSLAGLAAAARLAKAGHPVELWEATDRLGGRFAPVPGPGGVAVDIAPAVLDFPAPWRDLFRKSGRTLEAELARSRAELVPAGPTRYAFADGSTLSLPTDRGEQFTTLSAAYGTRAAEAWRDLLDWLDDVWQAVRPLGLERELDDEAQLSRPVRQLLRPGVSLAELAAELDHPALGAILRSLAHRQGAAPEQTPAWAAVTASIERRFGRWTIAAAAPDPADRTGRTSTLVEALVERLRTRRVAVVLGRRLVSVRRERSGLTARADDGTLLRPDRVVHAADPWQLDELVTWSSLRRTRRRLRSLAPARTPVVSHRLVGPAAAGVGHEPVTESVRLSPDGVPCVRYRRPTSAGVLETEHDLGRARPDPAAGVAWRGFRSWFQRPPVRTELAGLVLAGPWSAAGNGLSATLLCGALASYAAHDGPGL